MKKVVIFILFFVSLGMNVNFAAGTVKNHKSPSSLQAASQKELSNVVVSKHFPKIFPNKIQKAKKIYKKLSKKLDNQAASLRTAIILMVIGLIFLILASAIRDGGIVWAVGVIFFLIGAILLLLELL